MRSDEEESQHAHKPWPGDIVSPFNNVVIDKIELPFVFGKRASYLLVRIYTAWTLPFLPRTLKHPHLLCLPFYPKRRPI